MAKATHYGICQVCGRRQTLPNGRLSKHGYEVSHGFFNGVCFGAGHLPFEQSKDMVEADIERCLAEIPKREVQAAAIRANRSVVWVHEYVPASYDRGQRHSYYAWREIKVENMIEIGYFMAWKGKSEKTERTQSHISMEVYEKIAKLNEGPDSPEAVEFKRTAYIDSMNDRRARGIDEGIRQLKSHITHQQIRIDGWEPKELEEIKRVN